MILCAAPGCFLLLAPECSSWTLVNRGTTKRSVINWKGLFWLPSVQKGTGMMSRFLGDETQTHAQQMKHSV